MVEHAEFDREAVVDELEQVRLVFRGLLQGANSSDLRRASTGTRWTNEQLLFHMLFGYIIVLALLRLVQRFSWLPSAVSRGFARILDATLMPFNAVNYWGSCVGALVFNHDRMGAKLDRVIKRLQRRVLLANARELSRGMHYPTRWDPFFREYMTLGELFRYPTQHFDFHRRQLTLGSAAR